MSKSRNSLFAAALGAAMFIGATGSADATTYYLNGVTFSGGGTASGYFSTNVSGYLDGWSITTTNGTITGHLYTNTINASYSPGDAAITFYYDTPSYGGYLYLVIGSPIEDITTFATLLAGSSECADYGCAAVDPDVRYASGSISLTAPAVPEPGSWAMMILGLGAAGAALRTGTARRRRSALIAG